jgi:hypothetical protein
MRASVDARFPSIEIDRRAPHRVVAVCLDGRSFGRSVHVLT